MQPKAAPAASHSRRFPNESKEYREARAQLLEAGRRLRDQVEEVAALPRRLPPGGELKVDYVFAGGGADVIESRGAVAVKLSELFENGKNSLLIYSISP